MGNSITSCVRTPPPALLPLTTHGAYQTFFFARRDCTAPLLRGIHNNEAIRKPQKAITRPLPEDAKRRALPGPLPPKKQGQEPTVKTDHLDNDRTNTERPLESTDSCPTLLPRATNAFPIHRLLTTPGATAPPPPRPNERHETGDELQHYTPTNKDTKDTICAQRPRLRSSGPAHFFSSKRFLLPRHLPHPVQSRGTQLVNSFTGSTTKRAPFPAHHHHHHQYQRRSTPARETSDAWWNYNEGLRKDRRNPARIGSTRYALPACATITCNGHASPPNWHQQVPRARVANT